MAEAVFFSEENHKGASRALGIGRHQVGKESSISSARVPQGWTATLYTGTDFDGEQHRVTGDAPTLGGFNNRTASIEIAGPPVSARASILESETKIDSLSDIRVVFE
ncbi:hypothetical protein [Kitasatospora cineracea]|uniref:hypothetical protein n=1 Tax=Kitasatospora cineracea TaxID=88074 RepID=UPI003802F86B